ncbi:MAG: HD domain-containing protein [Acidobacteriota bacterium]|jgi:putative nucleotidyltransferase with HDIG domain
MSTTSARNQLQSLAARIQSARQAMQIYPPRHPHLEQALEECFAELSDILGNDPRIQIAYADGEFVLGNFQVPARGEVLEEFAATLAHISANKLIFIEGVRRWELQRFLRLLSSDPAEVAAKGGIECMLADAGVTSIEAGSIKVDTAQLPDTEVLFRTWEAYSMGLKAVRGIKQRVREDGKLGSIDDLRDFAYRVVELAIQESRPLLAVHALKLHDEYSFTHSTNVAMLTLAMARNLPFSDQDLREITLAALLHDVGKERVPLEILQKPGKLTDEEWLVMNRHSIEGARMLADTEGVGDLAPVVAYEHHLAYHEELRDPSTWKPHLVSQLVCLADVYDALRSTRAYREGMPADKAMRIMQQDAGAKFDPVLFDGFYRLIGPYPPGTVVRLESGSAAVTFANNPEQPELPQVVCVLTASGTSIEPARAINLAAADCDERIAEVVAAADLGIDPANYL